MTLMILLLSLLVYAVGWPVAYRRQWVRNETERRRGDAKPPRDLRGLVSIGWYSIPALAIVDSLLWIFSWHPHRPDAINILAFILALCGTFGFIPAAFLATEIDAPGPINNCGQFRPTCKALLWPAALAVAVTRCVWSWSHVGVGLKSTAGMVGRWLHPEIQIPDPEKLKALDEEIYGR